MTASHDEGTSIFDPLNVVKSLYSVCLLSFSTALVMACIFTRQTKVAEQINPIFAFVVLWICTIWLTMIEGSQASIVGLQHVNPEKYKKSHPLAYIACQVAHKGDNLKRFLLGRQFMVVLVVFAINNAGHGFEDTEIWGLPKWILTLFIGSGLAMIFFTVMVGQLSSEVNAALCMLDYINNYFAILTVYVALALEFSGILHSAYIIQMCVCKIAGKPIDSNEPPRDDLQNFLFYGRAIFAIGCLFFAFAVTMKALFDGNTTIWKGIPIYVSIIIFVLLMSVVGLLEATQIAYFAVAKLKPDERGTNVWAKLSCKILFKGEGTKQGCVNLPGYMIGRQLCVVSCMFFVARVTSLNIKDGEPTVFGVSEGTQKFFNTGLLGALIVTIVASIAWRLAGQAFPIFFLSTPPAYIFLRICMGLEGSGMLNGAWVLGWIHKKIARYQQDEIYIGSAEDRARQERAELEKKKRITTYAPPALRAIMDQDPTIEHTIHTVRHWIDETLPPAMKRVMMENPEIVAYVYNVAHDPDMDTKMGHDDTSTEDDIPAIREDLSEDYA
jgi:Silicon transporter